jgi:hypothetical protein
VELGGRDGMITFNHGLCAYFIPKPTRINGGWWISIARHLRIFFCFTTLISDATKVVFAEAFQKLIKMNHMTKNPVFKTAINDYKQDHEDFVEMLIHIYALVCFQNVHLFRIMACFITLQYAINAHLMCIK